MAFFFLIGIVLCFSHQLKKAGSLKWYYQKKNKRKTKENKKTELLDWKCMTSRILSQNATIIAISALPFHFFLRPKIPLYFYGCKLLVQSRMLLEWKFEKKDVLKKDKNRNNTKQNLHFGLLGLAGLSTSRKRRHQESDYEPLSTLRVFLSLCLCPCLSLFLPYSPFSTGS